jgi:SAM-dependent methyltransferase
VPADDVNGNPLTIADYYDAELRRHNERFRTATRIESADRVLDVGCGTGLTTREAGRAAVLGSVLGVDISASMLERARRLTAADGLHNVSYELGDIQDHPLAAEQFDVVISRFGTMFFDEPHTAFRNIARAMRPRARLVMLVWRSRDCNEWLIAIQTALAGGGRTSSVPSSGPGPFSLAERAPVQALLESTGFSDVDFEEVREPVYYGPNGETAFEVVRSMRMVDDLVAALDSSETDRAFSRLRAILAEHAGEHGVEFDSRAWLVSAQRRTHLTS